MDKASSLNPLSPPEPIYGREWVNWRRTEINKVRAARGLDLLDQHPSGISGYIIGCYCDGCKQMDIDQHNAIRELERETRPDMSKLAEYKRRGLPHVWSDGRICQCSECSEARYMGLKPWLGTREEAEQAKPTIGEYYDQQTQETDKVGLTDVPFVIEWLMWDAACSLPTAGLAFLLQHMTPIAPILALGWVVRVSMLVGLILTLARRIWYEAHKLAPYKRMSNDEYKSALGDPIFRESETQRVLDEYEQRAASRRRWSEADARNGLHRDEPFDLDGGLLGDAPTDELGWSDGYNTTKYDPPDRRSGWTVKLSFRRERQ